MAVLHQRWFNLNSQRAYPIDETASGISDSGEMLPFGILADCVLRFPDTYGKFAFLSAVSVSERLVTLCFSGSNIHPGLVDSEVPEPEPESPLLATLSLLLPVTEGRHYSVVAEKNGVAGWVVFGGNLSGLRYTGHFSSARQSVLLPRCGRNYVGAGVTSVGKQSVGETLSGLINLAAGNDVRIDKQSVEIYLTGVAEPRTVTALVFSLATSIEKNVFQVYAGPCSGRPESNTCSSPGIVSLGEFTPDCAGNIQIDFQWPGHVVPAVEYWDPAAELAVSYIYSDASARQEGGIVVDFKYGLDQTCPGSVSGLPDTEGNLPHAVTSTCEYSSSSISIEDEPSEPIWEYGNYDTVFDETFTFDSDTPLSQFAVVSGSFAASVNTTSDTWLADGVGVRNIAVLKTVRKARRHATSLGVQLVATLRQGAHRNAGILFFAPFRGTDPDVPPQYHRYYYVYMDHETDSIGVMLHRMPGPVSPVPEIAVAYPLKLSPAGLQLNHPYQLDVMLSLQNEPDGVLGVPVLGLTIHLREPAGATLQTLSTKVYDPLYDVAAGTNRFDYVQVGLMAEQSNPYFKSFRYVEQNPF